MANQMTWIIIDRYLYYQPYPRFWKEWFTRSYDFLAREKLLSPYQCGFRKGHFTDLAVLSFTDSIRRSMDQGLLTGAVFIDLRKAFDTVDHDLLLEKLTMGYGVTGKELGWFRDYLTDRRQVVTVQSTLSDPCDVAFGVPQGSIPVSYTHLTLPTIYSV